MAYDGFEIDDNEIRSRCERVLELRNENRGSWPERYRIRQIMDGGAGAVGALLGDRVEDPDFRLPIANLMLTASSRLAQKLGRQPDVKIDAPITTGSARSIAAADKRVRIVSAYDDLSQMDMMLPQLARWLPGYGYAAIVVTQRLDDNGQPWPCLELRDPYETFLSDWGVNGQPYDMACIRIIAPERLAKYPNLTSEARASLSKMSTGPGYNSPDRGGWENANGRGIEVYEYYDSAGCWWMAPQANVLLSFTPNLLSGPAFHAFKRITFSKLTGQYDHIVGLLANIARVNVLATIAIEDSVLAETNIVGDLVGGTYNKGRQAINFFTPGTSVRKQNDQVPQQVFQYIDRTERQLRIVAGYPVTDDGQSPMSFTTGRGLQELASSIELEIREYQTILSRGLSALDAKRLEFDERYYPSVTKTMEGAIKGSPFAETYTPEKDIKGHRRTRRVYGAMAGYDEPAKIVTSLQLLQGGIIDDDTVRENIDGLDNHQLIKERILASKAEDLLMEGLLARAQQGDPVAIQAAMALMPESEVKAKIAEVFLAEAQAAQDAAAQPVAPPDGAPPNVNTILSRLTSTNGKPGNMVSAQTVGSF